MPWWLWLLVQLVVLGCASLVSVLCWRWFTRPHVDIPGPPTLPIVGNILEFYKVPVSIHKFRDLHRQYGDLTRFYVGPILVIVVAHPDDVQHVLLTSKLVDRDPFSTYAMGTFVGEGLITNKGAQWRLHRKLISPTFHSELLEGFLGAFHESGLSLSERLARSRGAATEVYPTVFIVALRTIFNTIIGIDPDLLIPDEVAEEELSAAMSDAMSVIQKMMVRPWLLNKFLLRLTSKGRGLFKYTQLLQNLAMKCITMRSETTEEGPPKKHLRLLEALVKPGGQTVIPLMEVRDEIMHLIVAGIEATSLTTSYALALLALHPEWQDAVHKELRDVFGEGDDYLRAANLADLANLKVLDSVLKETLRLFPALPLIPRVAPKDFSLSKGSVPIPEGALLAVSPFLTHRLPEFFPDPLRFNPSRFLEGGGGKEHTCCYLPFGLGARNCLGSQYGRLEIKVFMANILRRFRLLPHSTWEELDDGTLSVTQHPIKPIRLSFVPLHEPSTKE